MAATYANTVNKQQEYFLDIRPFFNAYECPVFEVLGAAVRSVFKADPKLIIQRMRGPLEGVFRIVPLGSPSHDFIRLKRKSRDNGEMEEVDIPLTMSNPSRRSRQDGDLLITICDADLGQSSHIVGREFDTALAEFGVVIVPTQPQRYQNTNLFNGNRFCVINRLGKQDLKLPNRLNVAGGDFLIKYKGKAWMCFSCNKEHVGPCPYKEELYKTKDEKIKHNIKMAIIGDSTLRHVESVGLKADVDCMSGACAGQIATAIMDDPNMDKYSEVVLAFGANDTKDSDTFRLEDTLVQIDKSLQRVEEVISKKDNHSFNIINSTPPDDELSEESFIKRLYFKESLKKISMKFDNVKLIAPKYGWASWEEGHPNINGTKDIIRSLKKEHPGMVLNENLLVNERRYQGVNTLWLSGCTGCPTRGRFTSGGFCQSCLSSFETASIKYTALLEEARKKFKEEYPDSMKRVRDAESSSSNDERYGKKFQL